MDIKVIVATHKKADMPTDQIYYPVQVGALGKKYIGYQKDCKGDNISAKNPTYCELTGMYWAWKNLPADYIGLVHYRRLFRRHEFCWKQNLDTVLTKAEAEEILQECDVILPKKRNYLIETVYSHYCHTHHQRDLDEAAQVLKELYPDYYPVYLQTINRTSAHMFNMFIMKRDKFDAYCEWMFPILEELETRLDLTGYTPFEARVYGRISELLLDVWIEKNEIVYEELPVAYIGTVRWDKKIIGFLRAKFLGKGYKESF